MCAAQEGADRKCRRSKLQPALSVVVRTGLAWRTTIGMILLLLLRPLALVGAAAAAVAAAGSRTASSARMVMRSGIIGTTGQIHAGYNS